MRRYKPKGELAHEGFSIGSRSDFNGKIVSSIKNCYDKQTDTYIDRPYKVIKPYNFCVGDVRSNFGDFSDFGFSVLPDITEVVNFFFEESGANTDYLLSIVDLDYAKNGAIESSQAYGELLMFVSASEAKQTIKMIRSLFIRVFNIVIDIYNSVKKLNVVATVDIITDIWLEYRYGWRPFIGEVSAIYKALTVVRPSGIKSAYGLYKSSDVTSVSFSKEIEGPHGSSVKLLTTMDTLPGATVKTGFNYVNTKNSRNDDWSAIFGLDWESLASTAWELVPFSFIIDMFLNLGNMLQASDFADQVDSFNGYGTFRHDADIRTDIVEIVKREPYKAVDLLSNNLRYSTFKTPGPSTQIHPVEVLIISFDKILQDVSSVKTDSHYYTWHDANSDFAPWGRTIPYAWDLPMQNGHEFYRDVVNTFIIEIKDFYKPGWPTQIYRNDWRCFLDGLWSTSYALSVIDDSVAGDFYTGNLILNDGTEVTLAEFLALCRDDILSGMWDPSSVTVNSEYHAPSGYKGEYWSHDQHRLIPLSKIVDPATLPPINPEDLYQDGRVRILLRRQMAEFSHSFTADTDLSSPQYADLAAFAFKLGSYFKNR